MTKKRNRKRPGLSLQDRLRQCSEQARRAARELPPGEERAALQHRARDMETAAAFDLWFSSASAQPAFSSATPKRR
jgi:hypothetical protein